MAPQVYRVAVIGCGRIASTIDDEIDYNTWQLVRAPLAHAGGYKEHPRTDIVAASDVLDTARQAFGQRWGVQRLYADYEEMLAKEKPDIVSICTRPQHHADITEKVAAAGVKAIFVEKPLATTMAEADRMVAACEAHGVKVSVNHGRHWHPQYGKVKELLDEGAIGELRTITGMTRGGLLNMGSHLFEVMCRYAGEAAWVAGTIPNRTGGDDNGYGTIGFKSGVAGLVDQANAVEFIVTLYGTKGILIASDMWDGFRLFSIGALPSERMRGRSQLAELPFPPMEGPKQSMTVNAVDELVRWLDGDGSPGASGIRLGRHTMEIGVAFHESHLRDGARVELPLAGRDLQIRFK